MCVLWIICCSRTLPLKITIKNGIIHVSVSMITDYEDIVFKTHNMKTVNTLSAFFGNNFVVYYVIHYIDTTLYEIPKNLLSW